MFPCYKFQLNDNNINNIIPIYHQIILKQHFVSFDYKFQGGPTYTSLQAMASILLQHANAPLSYTISKNDYDIGYYLLPMAKQYLSTVL